MSVSGGGNQFRPRVFRVCPKCNKKGLYSTGWRGEDGKQYGYDRCQYCKWQQNWKIKK